MSNPTNFKTTYWKIKGDPCPCGPPYSYVPVYVCSPVLDIHSGIGFVTLRSGHNKVITEKEQTPVRQALIEPFAHAVATVVRLKQI